jgi:ABC-type uncharacterized transport system substrate-binding protein
VRSKAIRNLKPVVSKVEPSKIQNAVDSGECAGEGGSADQVKQLKRINTVLLLIGFVLASIHLVEAQQPKKLPRIGYIATAGDSNNPGLVVAAFREGLRDLGYIEGKNIIVEYRYPGTEPERLTSFVPELIRLKVDALVTSSTAAIRAAKETTKIIPIVMIATFDPVRAGMADSLARPGRNITGVLRLTHELSGKRLELVKEAVPRMSRVGSLRSEHRPVCRTMNVWRAL